jgi:hypothetical protein
VLIIKFDKSRKTGTSDFPLWTVQFQQFQNKAKERAKLEDLKVQGVLRQEKGIKGIKAPR